MLRKLILLTALISVALGAVPSLAAETSREDYVAAVDPICKANTEANEKILRGVRAKVKAGKLDAASRQFKAAARALKATHAQILVVPKPTADASRLTKWLATIKTEIGLFEAAGNKLAKGELTAAQKMVIRLTTVARQANNQVLPMEFFHCRFQPSKFV